jgi:hypothetical protein
MFEVKNLVSAILGTIVTFTWLPLVAAAGSLSEPTEHLVWTIGPSKSAYLPGEPLPLILGIQNKAANDEGVFNGYRGIGGFSFEMLDGSGRTVASANKIEGIGGMVAGRLYLPVPAGGTANKTVVLNRWCSTILPPAEYRLICRLEYRLQSERTPIPGSDNGFNSGPLHHLELSTHFSIQEADPSKYEAILGSLQISRSKKPDESSIEWYEAETLAREMVVLAEWEAAVPYQLRVLNVALDTWLRQDAIRALGRSKNPAAARGLVAFIDGPTYVEDVKVDAIGAVYTLRGSGNPEILAATEDLVRRHPRPDPPKTD